MPDLQRHLPNIHRNGSWTATHSHAWPKCSSQHPVKEKAPQMIVAGLLKANRLQRRWQVPVAEVARFRDTYCLAPEACQILEISRSTLARREGAGKIRPVYSRKQHAGAGASLFRRVEIESLSVQDKAA